MMKLIFTLLFLTALNTQAATIRNAKYDAESDTLLLRVLYGGCNLETFQLNFGVCTKSFPSQVYAELDDTKDICRGYFEGTIKVSLSEFDCRPAHLWLSTKLEPDTRLQVFIPENN